jgi:nitric oxide reductase subunit B
LFTGIVGTGHHYYWIGTPNYWLWWGGIFSALEPLPILFMVIDTIRVVRERKIEIPNRIAMNWAVGCAIMHFFGAGVWGFAHTLPQINQWTHGTQITASHGHFAFFGAYVMLNITMMYFAMPQLRGVRIFDQGRGRKAFWFMNFFMILIALALAVAGIVQVYFQRVLGMDYLTTQGFMKLWYAVFWVSAWGFAAGVVIFLIDFFKMATAKT